MSTKPARVLVTYSTAAGSTAGIAERIAQVLRSAGCTDLAHIHVATLENNGQITVSLRHA